MRLKDRVLLSVPQVEISNLARKCKMTEVENNPILKSCGDEPRRPVPTQLEHVPR